MHLGMDYVAIAEDQLADPEIQAFRSEATGLHLDDIQVQNGGVTLLCNVTMGQPRPTAPIGWH